MRITSKGQVTIPQAIRDRFGLKPGTEVEFVPEKDRVIVRAAAPKRDPVEGWLQRLRGSATGGLTTDEIMAMTRGED